MVSEFVAAINQICSERGIEPEAVYQALENAVLAAYKREYDVEGDIVVEMDREDGSFRVIAKKIVVADVEDPDLEISVKEAQKIEPILEEGDTLEIEQSVEGFGRIAAQTAKQVIMQRIREFEKDAILEEYSDKIGEIFTAMMQRMLNGHAVMEIGKAVALMPPEEQVQNEFYRIGDRYKVLLKEIEDSSKGRTLIITRSDPAFLKGLFKMEVPEIESGVVEIMGCAREAGSRSKMSVRSHQDGVDPIGSCVGQRGIRIANVISEMGEEKIDIIEWKEDIEEYVEKALSPAKVLSVKVDDSVAIVKVDEDQLSLAIGKDGQNVRLAAKLTGLKIDIQGPDGVIKNKEEILTEKDTFSEDETEVVSKSDVEESEGGSRLDETLVKKIEDAGKSVDNVKDMSVDELKELKGIGEVTANKIFESLHA